MYSEVHDTQNKIYENFSTKGDKWNHYVVGSYITCEMFSC